MTSAMTLLRDAVRRRVIHSVAPLAVLLVASAACAPSTQVSSAPMPGGAMSGAAPSPDPRIGLKAGVFDAGEAAWNLRLVSTTPPPDAFVGKWNSDLAFTGNYVIQGNFNGFQIWDISNASSPTLVTCLLNARRRRATSPCTGTCCSSRARASNGRMDCGTEGVTDAVSKDRLRGIRIFDISDIRESEVRRATCRRAAVRTRTRCSRIRRIRRTSTSTSPARRRVRPADGTRRMRQARRRTTIRTRRSSASK